LLGALKLGMKRFEGGMSSCVFALVLGAGDLIPLFCDTLFGEAGMKRLRLEGLEGGAAVAVLSFFPKTANASLYPCLLL